jgi:hypothetical protein
MPLQRKEIGSNLFLFTIDSTPGKHNSEALIIAHGLQISANPIIAQKSMGKRWKEYDPVLHYYAPHGKLLSVYPETQMVSANVPCQVIRASESPNYLLSKGVNSDVRRKHVSQIPLSYAALEEMDETVANLGAKLDAKGERFAAGLFKGYSSAPRDIISIRARKWMISGHILLSSVIAGLASANFKYNTIHCSFCRGTLESNAVAPESMISLTADLKLGTYR